MNDTLVNIAAVLDELIEMADKARKIVSDKNDRLYNASKARDLSIAITALEDAQMRVMR